MERYKSAPFTPVFNSNVDPSANICYPELSIRLGVRYTDSWCGFIKVKNLLNGEVIDLGSTDVLAGEMDNLIVWESISFSVPFIVGYTPQQFLSFEFYVGDNDVFAERHLTAVVKANITRIAGGETTLPMLRGSDYLGDLVIWTEIHAINKTVKLFSKENLYNSLGFQCFAPCEDDVRSEHEFFNEVVCFFSIDISSDKLLELDKKGSKSLPKHSFQLRFYKADVIPLGDGQFDYAIGSKMLYKSRILERAPFKLKVRGLTFSNEELLGYTDSRLSVGESACILCELVLHTGLHEHSVVGRCHYSLDAISRLGPDENFTRTEQLVAQGITEDDCSTVDVASTTDSVVHPEDGSVASPRAPSRRSMWTFFRSNSNSNPAAPTVQSSEPNNESDDVEQVLSMLKMGSVRLRVKKFETLQKVGAGNDFYEHQLQTVVEHLRSMWTKKMIRPFHVVVNSRRLESIRMYHFLQRINAGWKFKCDVLVDMYHPCLQRTLNSMSALHSRQLTSTEKSCSTLRTLLSLFDMVSPFTSDEGLSVVAGGWISAPLQRQSRFNTVAAAKDTSDESMDMFVVRNIAFPAAEEYLSCHYQYDNLPETARGACSFFNSWFSALEFLSSTDSARPPSPTSAAGNKKEFDEMQSKVDPHGRWREWASAVSQDEYYALKTRFVNRNQLIKGYLEAGDIYYPAHHMSHVAQGLWRKRMMMATSELHKNADSVGDERNEARRTCVFVDTDFVSGIDVFKMCAQFAHQSNVCHDITALRRMLTAPSLEKELRVVTWVVGRCPNPRELRQLRHVIVDHLLDNDSQSVLLILLSAEQRYDIPLNDSDMIRQLANPFEDLLECVNKAVDSARERLEGRRLRSGNISDKTRLGQLSVVLPVDAISSKLMVQHVHTWSEIMAEAYLIDDRAKRRQIRSSLVRQSSNNSALSADAEDSSEHERTTPFPSITSLKKSLHKVFSLAISEQILGRNHQDRHDHDVHSCDKQDENVADSKPSSINILNALHKSFEKSKQSKTAKNESHSNSGKREGLPSEISGFHELVGMKNRFDKELEAQINRQILDRFAIFLLSHDFNPLEYATYENFDFAVHS